INVPASALRRLSNARFYITRGAAGRLVERQIETVENTPQMSDANVEKALVDLSVGLRKRLEDLTEADTQSDRFVAWPPPSRTASVSTRTSAFFTQNPITTTSCSAILRRSFVIFVGTATRTIS
ncbi:MAG: hypothetical protein ACYSWZ_09215, partial [Planctomycetota bacterium]